MSLKLELVGDLNESLRSDVAVGDELLGEVEEPETTLEANLERECSIRGGLGRSTLAAAAAEATAIAEGTSHGDR